jgi:hypothetical protein
MRCWTPGRLLVHENPKRRYLMAERQLSMRYYLLGDWVSGQRNLKEKIRCWRSRSIALTLAADDLPRSPNDRENNPVASHVAEL